MPIDKEQFLKQFVKQALDERISLFLGAGGSCDAGYPNWADLFAPFARDLGTPINESTDYYRLAQYYSNSFGPGELRKRINERINRNNFESQLLEELIDKCKHAFKNGTLKSHIPKGKGCIVETYSVKVCTKCSSIQNKAMISSMHYVKCPHK